MNIKNNIFRNIVIILVIIIFITAALLLLEVWEKKQGVFSDSHDDEKVVSYNGKEYVPKGSVESFLVLGLDKYNGASASDSYNNDKQADFLMLFVLDNDNKSFSAIHINRDTMANVRVLAVDETKVISTTTKQIALAHTYGKGKEASCRNTKDSVEDLLQGITVNHYVSFTMDSVAAMNDFVGGVELTVLDDFSGIDDALVKGERVTLMGEQALRYVRTRYGLEDSTNSTRMKRQQQYINALYEKTVSCIRAQDGFLVELVELMDDYVVYNSSNHKMQKLAEKFDEYDFKGIVEIEGETRLGDEFMEFYADEDSVWSVVLDLFYTVKEQ